jgi:hypothetical protein
MTSNHNWHKKVDLESTRYDLKSFNLYSHLHAENNTIASWDPLVEHK